MALGVGYYWCGKNDEARENLDYALELRRKTLGDLHPKTKENLEALSRLNTVTGDYKIDLGVCEEICRIDSINLGNGHQETIVSRISVADALERLGKYSDALKLMKNTKQAFLAESPDNINVRSEIDVSLSWLLLQNGHTEEAEKIAKANYDLASTKIEESWYIEKSKSSLAAVLIAQGKLEEARQLYGNYPTYQGFDREYNIQGDFNQDESEIHLVIFWEEWCPHCDKMMRKVEKLYRQYKNYGFDVVGLTNLWEPSTRELSEKFIGDHNVSFPIIKEGGATSDHFNATGVPSIRLVYQGYLIWDHQMISSEPISRLMLDGIVKSQQSR